MPRLTANHLAIISTLQNGGWIWTTAGHYYLARIDKDGRVHSENIKLVLVNTLLAAGAIVAKPDNPKHFILA